MIVLYTFLYGLVVWLVLWAIGVGSFDAFMLLIAMVLVAIGWMVFSPFLPGNRGDDDRSGSGGSWRPRG